VGRAPLNHAQKGTLMNKDAKESTEQVITYRDKAGEIIAFIFEEQYRDRTIFTAYGKSTGGYKWFEQSEDKEEILEKARQHVFYHSHFCPTCKYDVECEQHFHCDDPEKEILCEECAESHQPEDAHLESEYESRTDLDCLL
jgi:hypothetical protein